ncbi:MAG: phosphate ABC transporter permease subunit PstC [Gammaproteobacteria bacterium]|nr:phosphate ABC transporter permease subunit PstC [Gammaproteobacteria bacterium]
MSLAPLALFLISATAVAYFIGYLRAFKIAKPLGGVRNLAALPTYYASMVSLWALIPGLIVLALWVALDGAVIESLVKASLPEEAKYLPADKLGLVLNQVALVAQGLGDISILGLEYQAAVERQMRLTQLSRDALPLLVGSIAIISLLIGLRSVTAAHNARYSVERLFNIALFLCSCIAILTTVGIVFSVMFESWQFFQLVPLSEFLFGTHWSPQIAIRADQAGASGSFGVLPLIVGTLLISAIALLIAVPVGLLSAIYLSEYASARVRNVVKPALEILAGVPTVVYGFFAALTVAPAIREVGDAARAWGAENGVVWLANLNVSSESALAAGMVMGIMIIPFVSSLSDDVINAVPQSLRDGSYGLGATQSETIKKVIFPAALPGIVGGILLAASRAIGETMIVVMAAGLAANLTVNPLEAVTTVTVQIVTLLVGDQEFDSAKTLAAFALGLFLFLITLALNIVALRVVKKYREQYE